MSKIVIHSGVTRGSKGCFYLSMSVHLVLISSYNNNDLWSRCSADLLGSKCSKRSFTAQKSIFMAYCKYKHILQHMAYDKYKPTTNTNI